MWTPTADTYDDRGERPARWAAEMRGWQVISRGAAEFCHDLPRPSIGGDESIVVEVHAAAANFADRLMIDGKYQLRPDWPFVPGFELAGVVIESATDRVRVGDRVAGVSDPAHGSWAEFAVADARHVTVLPDDLGWVDAIGLHVNAQTAWFALHRAGRLRQDDVVLVHAAAGGVGSMAIQLAHRFGCRVVGTSSAGKTATVARLGADLAVDNRDPDWPSLVSERFGTVDVVIDPVGDAVFAGSWKVLGFEGRYVSVGFTSGAIPTVAANQALVKNASLHGMYYTPYATRHPELVARAADEIFGLHRDGLLDPLVTKTAPLEDALECVDEVTAGATTGKVVLTVTTPPPGGSATTC